MKKAAELGVLLAVILSCSFSSMAMEGGQAEEGYLVSAHTESPDDEAGVGEGVKDGTEDGGREGAEGGAGDEAGEGAEGGTGDEAGEGAEGGAGDGGGESTEGGAGEGAEGGAGDEAGEGAEGGAGDEAGEGAEGGTENEAGEGEEQGTEDIAPEGLLSEEPLLSEIQLLEGELLADGSPDIATILNGWGIGLGTDNYITNIHTPELLPDELIIPEGVEGIRAGGLQGGTFSSVIMPDSLKLVGQIAFAECENLKRVTFGSGIETIVMQAFYKCASLEYVDLGRANNLEIVSSNLFAGSYGDPVNTINLVVLNDKSIDLWGSISRMFSGVYVKNLRIVREDGYIGSEPDIVAAANIWYNVMNMADDLGLDITKLRSVSIEFTYNGVAAGPLELNKHEAAKLIMQSYFTDERYDAKTPEELWELCFGTESAKYATVGAMTSEKDGEGVTGGGSFMDIYNGLYRASSGMAYIKDYIDNGGTSCSAKMEAVYGNLVNQLNQKAGELQTEMDTGITFVEKEVQTAAQSSETEMPAGGIAMPADVPVAEQEIMPADVPVAEPEIMSADVPVAEPEIMPADVPVAEPEIMPEADAVQTGLPESVSEAPAGTGELQAAAQTGEFQAAAEIVEQQEQPVTVQTPEELYRWGIICTDGVISGVSDSRLLPEVLVLPGGVTRVGGLGGQSGIREVVLPDSVEVVESQAFRGCANLQRVTFGSGVRQIQARAFQDCTGIQIVDLSRASRLELMGEGAFGAAEGSSSAVIGQFLLNPNILDGGSCVNALWNVQVQGLILT